MPASSVFTITGGNPQSVGSGEAGVAFDSTKNTLVVGSSAGLLYDMARGSFFKANYSTATVSGGYASDTYLAGSSIAMPTGPTGYVVGARYRCVFDMVKTAAGTAQFTITLRIGTAGTTADASILSFAFAAGTAAADTGMFEVNAHFRTVGSGTSAVMVGTAECRHALAATGLISTGASGQGQIVTVSSGFDSTTASTIIGLSVNGGASFSGTNTIVETEYRGF